jgi:type I restriction enzyme, S subunit
MEIEKILLKEIAHSQTGPFGSQLHEEDYVDDGTPIVTVEHLGEIGFLLQNLPCVSDSDKNRLSKYILKEGDIVFSRVGSIDRCTFVSDKEDGWMFSGRCIRVRCNSKASSKYISFYFRLKNFKKMMLNISVGATMPSLNTTLMDNIPLFLPELKYQQKIAAVLSALDAKIELNNRINTELEAMAKTLYDYWFVQFDFPFDFAQGKPDPNGKPYKSSGGKMVYNETLKREIPEGWEAGKISDLFMFNPTLSLSKKNTSSYIDMSALPTSGFMTASVKIKEYNGGVKFQNGDVAVARITPCLENGKTGMITLLEDDEIGFGSTEFIILRGKNRSLSSFAACLSRSESFRQFAISNMTGTSGRKRIEAKILQTFYMPIPNEGLLVKFEDTFSSFFKQLTVNTKQNQQLTQLRDWLLPMLMNGQVTVK